MSDTEPIRFRPREDLRRASGGPQSYGQSHQKAAPVTAFNRVELDRILAVYSRYVAAGEWRDYALEMGTEKAVFAIFQRASEYPLFRIEKCPRLAKKQGAFSVVARSGQILKRGHDLDRVLAVLDP